MILGNKKEALKKPLFIIHLINLEASKNEFYFKYFN